MTKKFIRALSITFYVFIYINIFSLFVIVQTQLAGMTQSIAALYSSDFWVFVYFNCSCKMGVKYSATFNVSTATPIVATPSASFPVTVCMATRSLTVM